MSARAAFRLSALVLNPWFIFTQAPFAARKARVLIERLRVDLPAMNLSGMLGLIDLTDARLLVHQGKRARRVISSSESSAGCWMQVSSMFPGR